MKAATMAAFGDKFFTPASRLGSGRLGGRASRASRTSSGRTPSARSSRWAAGIRRSGHARLRVVSSHDLLGNIGRLGGPQYRALLAGDIENERVAVLLGELVQHVQHLAANTVRDVVLLALELALSIFHLALQSFLLGLDVLDHVGAGVLVELIALRLQLLLEVFDFLVKSVQVVLLGLKFFLQSTKVALSLVGGHDRALNVD